MHPQQFGHLRFFQQLDLGRMLPVNFLQFRIHTYIVQHPTPDELHYFFQCLKIIFEHFDRASKSCRTLSCNHRTVGHNELAADLY